MRKFTNIQKDAISITITAIVVFILVYVLLGYYQYGLSIPGVYSGGDDFTIYADTKAVIDNGWLCFSENTGAPYGSEYAAQPSKVLCNFDFLLAKVISVFTGDVITVVNIQFLLIFPMCVIIAFMVLRSMEIKRSVAIFGAVLYAFSPYIVWRNIGHLAVAQCYFIPLSIYLCLWASKGDNICSNGSDFKRKAKELLPIIICCILTANNGTGYYQFFTCFFIASTALMMLIGRRNLKAVKRSLFALILVLVFSIISLIPYFEVILLNGHVETVTRSVADGELYGLKITQFFIPLNDHGNESIAKLIEKYNGNMPLVNENSMAYLGIGGITGFILSLLILLSKNDGSKNEDMLHFLSKLNLFAVLYATIGGFSSLFSLSGFLFVRAYNRVSIFVMFISICILCIMMQKLLELADPWNTGKKKFVTVCAGLFVILCLYDVLPLYADNRFAVRMEDNQRQSELDRAFINEIDCNLQSGDMVYQLPYHKYANGGSVKNMPEYYHFIGNFYSDDLKWSFGGVKGLKSDRWNEFVSGFPIDKRINILIASGFRGIYIDRRAYSEDELSRLCMSIEAVLGSKPIISEDESLMFYNLYPYIATKPELLEFKPLDMSDIEGKFVFSYEQLPYGGAAEYTIDSVLLHPQSLQYGPYTHLDTGSYRVTVYGDNLDICEYDVAYDMGQQLIPVKEVLRESGCLVYDVVISKPTDNIEFRMYNNSTYDIELSYFIVSRINESGIE